MWSSIGGISMGGIRLHDYFRPDGPLAKMYTRARARREVSWFQESPSPSLELIALADAEPTSPIVDIGGGAARLVDALLTAGYADLTVLDLSDAALAASRARLGAAGEAVNWIVADVTTWQPTRNYDVIWHDRAARSIFSTRRKNSGPMSRVSDEP